MLLKNLRLSISILALALILILAGTASYTRNLTCQVFYRDDTQLRAGSSVIKAEVASTPAQRERGLGGRTCMSPNTGMLFVFDHPDKYSFWMKDMLFSIDIVWIDSDNQVVKVQHNVSPSSYPHSFTNVQLAQYVLEVKAGQAAALGLHTGSSITFKLK